MEGELSRDFAGDALGGVDEVHFGGFFDEGALYFLFFCEKVVDVPITHLFLYIMIIWINGEGNKKIKINK